MSMSAKVQADKSGTSYTVKKIGKKLQKHGGLKVGEKLTDTHVDDLKDSGIKVKFKPYTKEGMDPFADSITFNELEVSDWGDRTQDLQELSPQTVSSYQKKAGAQYRDLKKDSRRLTDDQATAGEIKGYISSKEADKGRDLQQKYKKRGTGLAMSKGKGMAKESIQRRMDRKTIIATDPATGRKVVKIAPKKEIDVGKGKMESVVNEMEGAQRPVRGKDKQTLSYSQQVRADMAAHREAQKKKQQKPVNEISNKLRMNYISKANKKITDTEKMRDYQNKQMDKKPGSFSKADKDFVNKKYDKDTMKRRKGVALAKSNLQSFKSSNPGDEKPGSAFAAGMRTRQRVGEEMKPMKKPEYSNKEVRMGKGVAFDKRYKGGNMTGAYKTINKIKKGLGDHPKVADALRRANEEFTTKGE